jgi:prepilin-type N-terminal cleavage/methylation domain-containing protein
MKKQNGFTLVELVIVLVLVIGVVPWIWNGVKFLSCDFESDYKCEVIHGAGVFIPPASLITVWFDDDDA